MATKHGKKFREAAAKVDRAAVYSPLEAVKLVKELSAAKFDETVEAHFRLGIDTRKADQNIRGSISLPHGTGKTVRVAVFAEGAQAEQAAEAGAMSSVPTSSSPRFRRVRSTSTPPSPPR